MRKSTILEMNLSDAQVEDEERTLLGERGIPHFGSTADPITPEVFTRPVMVWCEPLNRFPQNIFLVRIGGVMIVGRKLMSERHVAGELFELHCSAITASHVLGVFDGFHHSESEISVSYLPYLDSERRGAISEIAASPLTEIVFPFVYLEHGRERTSPVKGWSLDVERAENLGRGESDLRDFSVRILKSLGDGPHTLFDPACSTGQFLGELKAASPTSTTIGQDLSSEMVAYARAFVDQVHHGDAVRPVIPDGSASAVFCRFLNSEVVTTAAARGLVDRLRRVVAPQGLLVVFGHTPVLVRGTEIIGSADFEMIRANGATPSGSSVFQYYVARRIR